MNIILDIDGTICFDGQQINQDIIDRLISLHNIGHRIIFCFSKTDTRLIACFTFTIS